MQFSRQTIGIAGAIITVAIWTSFIIVARAMAHKTLTPFDIAFVRMIGAGIVMLPWGWWWVLPGAWWLYDRPYYPYPASPPVVIQPVPQEPVVVQPAPQPAAQTWYYCESARAYYPYVQTCPEGWRPVPAAPPPGTAPQPAAPTPGAGGVQ